MSGEVVNLRRVRKTRDREAAAAQASANRARFGRSKGERAAADLDAERLRRTVDGARLAHDEEPLA